MAKEIVLKSQPNSQPSKSTVPNGNQQRMCTTWNSFKQEGCHYEFNNPGSSCVFSHYCSHCKSKGHNRKHKLWQCNDAQRASVGATAPPVSGAPVVTSV